MWMKMACSLGWAAVKNYQEEYKDKMHESQEARGGSKGYRLYLWREEQTDQREMWKKE